MKKSFLIVVVCCVILPYCNSQEKKPVAIQGTVAGSTFEEKQKMSLKNETPVDISRNAALNFRYAAGKATPGVVHIKSLFSVRVDQEIPDFFREFFDDEFWRRHLIPQDKNPRRQMGSASGVIVSQDGYIVTNNHVVSGADSIEIVLHDQRNYRAKIIGTDPASDIALLKIDETNLSFIEFGNSDSVEVGDFVLAVGNPFNLASTVTAGIVSAKARNINILTDKYAVESYIQTDAALNQGNSGGALVDVNGRLIGINAAIATPTGIYAGYSFAIPVEIVKKTIDDLLNYGKVLHGYLGIFISNMDGDKARLLGIRTANGVLVDSLLAGGAGLKAGIKKNDVIIRIDNHKVENTSQLREIIARHHPDEELKLTIIRDGMEKIIPATLLPEKEVSITKTRENEVLNVLGIEVGNLSQQEKSKLKIAGGVKVLSISNGIIARNTNMQEGFVITRVNNKPVHTVEEFISSLRDKKGGIMLEGVYPDNQGVYYYAFGL